MTIYIRIPISPDNPVFTPENFAAAYLAKTGEVFVLSNMREEAGVMQMTGSNRATEAQMQELKVDYPMMKYDLEMPANWIPKIEDEN